MTELKTQMTRSKFSRFGREHRTIKRHPIGLLKVVIILLRLVLRLDSRPVYRIYPLIYVQLGTKNYSTTSLKIGAKIDKFKEPRLANRIYLL